MVSFRKPALQIRFASSFIQESGTHAFLISIGLCCVTAVVTATEDGRDALQSGLFDYVCSGLNHELSQHFVP
jgi:hypothetical protein